jgi:feruloyl esterase
MAAPWYIAGDGQNTVLSSTTTQHGIPDFEDAQHDVVLTIMAWLENGTAPDSIVATKYVNDDPTEGVERQRTPCPFPSVAVYDNSGNVDVIESWTCSTLY